MKKRDWVIIILLVVVSWAIDQGTKYWAVQNLGPLTFHGPFGLVLHRNPGAILGAFSNLPPILRIVSLSTGGAFLIFVYSAIQYLLPQRFFNLRAGMSLLLGGILGNVTDRILDGSVVDFLLVGSPTMTSPAFNFADAIQWVGYAMIVFSLIKEGNRIWPASNERKMMWVNPTFQIKYCMVLVFIGLGFSLVSGVYAYTFLKVTIEDIAVGAPDLLEQKFIAPFLMTFFIISMSFTMALFFIGMFLSHRTAGPLFAFERFLDDVLNGKDRPLRLRAGDEFTHLEELAEDIRDRLKSRFTEFTPAPSEVNKATPDTEDENSSDESNATRISKGS